MENKNLNLSYNEVLTETAEYFGMRGISITGEGYKEIATDAGLLEEYVQNLTQGMSSADGQAQMAQLLLNANAQTLTEASVNGITPIASLSMPVIRQLWPKFALKESLKVEVAKTPRFAITFQKPYMFSNREPGKRYYLPSDIFDRQNGTRNVQLKRQEVTVTLDVVSGSATGTFDLYSYNNEETPAKVSNNKQPLDKDVTVYVPASISATTKLPSTTTVGHKVMAINGAETFVEAGVTYFVIVDHVTGAAKVAAIGIPADTVTALASAEKKTFDVVLKGYLTEEFNESGWSVSFEVGRRDIEIPTGQHINAPMPIEWINDNRALYNIDSTKEVVDLMTNVISQSLDVEVLEFIDTEFEKVESTVHVDGDANSATDGRYERVFDLRPAAGFAGSPKAWREEIKPIVDDLAVVIKSDTYFNAGKFSIIGHPRDLNLFENIDWQFRGGQGTQVDGVNVEYSRGIWKGVYVYEVFASLNHPMGDFTMFFTPTTNTQMTYKYYPYTFNVEHKYLDPNRSNVPSIMMTKRHTFASHTPAIGRVYIENNNGNAAYKSTVDMSTKTWGTSVI